MYVRSFIVRRSVSRRRVDGPLICKPPVCVCVCVCVTADETVPPGVDIGEVHRRFAAACPAEAGETRKRARGVARAPTPRAEATATRTARGVPGPLDRARARVERHVS